MLLKNDLTIPAQTVPPHRESTPLTFDINDTPTDEEDDSDIVSNQSSDIEDETELKRFTQALQRAQIAALKNEDKKKQGRYSKKSEKTLKRRKQVRIDLASKGFPSLDQYNKLKGIQEKQDKLTSNSDEIVVRDESEEGSDEANMLD